MRTRIGLKTGARAAASAALVGLLLGLSFSPETADAQSSSLVKPRTYRSGSFILELDGALAARLDAAEGGSAVAQVAAPRVTREDELARKAEKEAGREGASGRPGQELFARKQAGPVQYEEIAIECDLPDMEPPLRSWITDTLGGKSPRGKNGALVELDANQSEVLRLEFADAQITQIELPALDASSKAPGRMTLSFQPRTTRYGTPRPARSTRLPLAPRGTPKGLASDYRIAIDGLDTSRVARIEPLVISQKLRSGQPAGLDVSNLVLSVAASGAPSLLAWHDSFVIQGQNGDAMEKSGKLTLLTPNLMQTLLTVDLKNLGILRVAPQSSEQGTRRFRAEMYCEQAAFTF
jgi:hypothetical protein